MAPQCYFANKAFIKRRIQNGCGKKSERISARVPTRVYETLVQASESMGATLNQFLVQSAFEKAQEVIENERMIDLTSRSANIFFNAVEKSPQPNKKLKNAVKVYKKTFGDDKS